MTFYLHEHIPMPSKVWNKSQDRLGAEVLGHNILINTAD